jgi:hydroxymethylglutaryl-CoA reductase
MKRSDISGFHKLSPEEKLRTVREFAGLDEEETGLIRKTGRLDLDTAGRMIENVIGTFELPFGIATNFMINGKDYIIPMVLEEPSVVAAASNAAKLARSSGGFTTESDEPVMIGQIQVVGVPDMERAKRDILANKERIFELANRQDSTLVKFGGGVKDVEARDVTTPGGDMLIVHLLVDVRDAMGANAVNTMAEAVSPFIEELSGGKTRLRIISNLAVHRKARAKAVWSREELGEEAIDRIIDAYNFAVADQFRCTTHNKGIMNGIDAVVLATGNDFRAIEAGAHSFAAFTGSYHPLTHYEKNGNGDLIGSIEIPLALGTVGGSTRTNPMARIALKILGVQTAKELSEVIASVGLAQNFAAMRALANEGIQQGHMKLHARNIAVIAGAEGPLVEEVAKRMIEEKSISVHGAQEILQDMNK